MSKIVKLVDGEREKVDDFEISLEECEYLHPSKYKLPFIVDKKTLYIDTEFKPRIMSEKGNALSNYVVTQVGNVPIVFNISKP